MVLSGTAQFLLAATVATHTASGAEVGSQRSEVRLFGLVVGTNVSTDPEVKPLRYADDDAVQNALLLGELGAQVVLLADMDLDTRGLFSNTDVVPPTKAAIRQAMQRLNELMAADRAVGKEPHLYFFYSGHGDVENNQGYVNLNDGRFWRDDLLALLRDSQATTNHVVIDACKSYFLVFDRGVGGQRAPLAGALIGGAATVPSNTGVLLSTSSATDSHEWEAFQGGVFSHEVRSALRGAADHDSDNLITYEETAAFVWSANTAVPNPRFRPKVFTKPPFGVQDEEAVLVDLRGPSGDRLAVGPDVSTHLFVENENGVRLVDFRPTEGHRVSVLLPPHRPLFVRDAEQDREVELPAGRFVELAGLSPRPITVARRGAEHVAFKSLFVRGFGPDTVLEYRERPPEMSQAFDPPTDWTWARRSIGMLGLIAGALGGTMTGLAVKEKDSVTPSTHGVRRHEVNDRIDVYNGVALASYSVAAVGLTTYLVWTLWPEREVDIQVLPGATPRVQLVVDF
jgi:hypothetical protein